MTVFPTATRLPSGATARSHSSGLPQDDGFIKNRYVARTFIQPGQELRKQGLRLKFNPLPEVVSGKPPGIRAKWRVLAMAARQPALIAVTPGAQAGCR